MLLIIVTLLGKLKNGSQSKVYICLCEEGRVGIRTHGLFRQSLNGTRTGTRKNGLHYFMFNLHTATYVGT